MKEKKFKKTKEDFTCHNCGYFMKGDGYTNHCLRCLWSKHVDVNPGDRQESCNGLMKPISVEIKKGEYIIIHKCISCGLVKKNKAAKEDNFNTILNLSKNSI